ncbi:glycosyltransferase family 4 protein [Arcobacter sp.]|uniref:glycosyltransferase family 4 protein n=1 Tax=Arcobacter sp. TaxID=1872629 RepID=UPI003D152C7D
MKVCQYIPHGSIPDVRGFAPSIVAQMFYKYFSKEIEHYFVCNKEEYTKDEEKTEFGKVFRISESKLYVRLFKKITKLDPYPLHIKLAKIINKNPVDILHVHQLEFPVNDFKKHLKNKNIKIIIHSHVMRKFDSSLGMPDKYIAVSNFTKEGLILDKGYPREKIEVVYNGVNTNLFKLKTVDEIRILKKEFNIKEDSTIISYIGRKQEKKGFYNSLKTFKYILNKYNNVICIAVGPTPYNASESSQYKESIDIIKELEKNSRFINLPPLKHDKLSNIFNFSDIILFPTYAEQHPLVALEAISSNNILISSNNSSLPEIIENNKTGFLIENPKDLNQIIEITEYVINNIDKLNDLRLKARNNAVNKFDWKISSQKLEDIYKEVKKGSR